MMWLFGDAVQAEEPMTVRGEASEMGNSLGAGRNWCFISPQIPSAGGSDRSTGNVESGRREGEAGKLEPR